MNHNISLICVYNNIDTYKNALVKSIETQSVKIELIGVDNTKNAFSSAAKALNYGASHAKGDYLVFAHQDIIIEDKDFFLKILEYESTYPESLLGIAGVGYDSKIYTNLVQGKDKLNGGVQFSEITEAQTLDEVLFSCSQAVYNRFKFDETVCDNWHLYGVDLSLSLKAIGIKSYIVPLSLYHLSSGTLSKNYATNLYKVIKKHRKNIKKIETTCSSTKTDWLRSTKYVLGLIWDHEIKK